LPLREQETPCVSSGLKAGGRIVAAGRNRHDAQGGDIVTWTTASMRAVAIVLYFIIATVWLPDFVLSLGFVESASEFLSDLVVTAVWAVALGGGIVALRIAQQRGLI
jgi:hypothetical protein